MVFINKITKKKEDSKAAPFCPLRTYTSAERRSTRYLIKLMVKNSIDARNIRLNLIYISTATKIDDNTEFYASEIPGKI
jgi:hypothetical protein